MRRDFGPWGAHVETFDVYEDWRDDRRRLIEAGINPRTGEAVTDMALFEASPDSKADFATFMWEPVQANFYAAYQRVESQYDKFIGKMSVTSFDEVRIKGINGLTGIGLVGELGEYPGLRRTFRPDAAVVIDTYGGSYAMTRKLLRSQGIDKIVALNPGDFGEAMADFKARMFIALVVANPNGPDGAPMLSSGRGNLATVDLSEDSLVDAAVWLRTRTNPDGRPIRTSLRTAVVQNDRQALRLRQIVQSQVLAQTAVDSSAAMADDKFGRGTSNPIADAGIIPPDGIIIDPYFPDAENVYFFSDPDVLPAFMRAYLDGQEQPFIGMADATVMHLSQSNGSGHDPYTFQGDAIEYKIRDDVGATAVEPLGVYEISPT